MSWLSNWLEKRHGGPVQRFLSEMQTLEEAGLRDLRKKLIGDLRGRILEIGCGTGFNFAHYHTDAQVIAIEPFDAFRTYAAQQTGKASASITVQHGDAHALAFADGEFDAVVGTLVFCTIPDPLRALAEIRRVAKPGAPVRLLEHVRHDRPIFGLLQDVANPLWQLCEGHGCNINRRTVQAVQASGLVIQQQEQHVSAGVEGVLFPLVEIHSVR